MALVLTKTCSPALAYPLSAVLSLSSFAHLPSANKSANITPIHKKGEILSIIHQEGSSQLQAVMESIIAVNVKSFLLSNSLIADHQFGFYRSHSTMDRLLLFAQQWFDAPKTQTRGQDYHPGRIWGT